MKRRVRKSTTRAFTLIELMLVMGMMAILAAAVGMALAQAAEQGRASRTQAQIARIHAILMTRYDSYRTRAIRIPNSYYLGLGITNPSARDRAVARLAAIRETMRLEMPERCHDIRHFTVSGTGNLESQITLLGAVAPVSGITRPALAQTYFRKVGDNKKFFLSQSRRNESSECLYLILSTINDGDTSGLDFLLPSEIGDTDADGMPEILDAWGTPIYFLRWAPGLASPLQNQTDPDPFDPLRVDAVRADGFKTFNLSPFVGSAGADRILGIVISKTESDPGDASSFFDHPHNYSDGTHNEYGFTNDPFCVPRTPAAFFGGGPLSFTRFGSELNREAMADNIINHFLQQQ